MIMERIYVRQAWIINVINKILKFVSERENAISRGVPRRQPITKIQLVGAH